MGSDLSCMSGVLLHRTRLSDLMLIAQQTCKAFGLSLFWSLSWLSVSLLIRIQPFTSHFKFNHQLFFFGSFSLLCHLGN